MWKGDKSNPAGHVAVVEDVTNGEVKMTEANMGKKADLTAERVPKEELRHSCSLVWRGFAIHCVGLSQLMSKLSMLAKRYHTQVHGKW